MQGILRDATGQEWRIETAKNEMSFVQWRPTVRKVTRMRFNVLPPNPNYEGRPDLERLIEGASLSAAEINLHSDNGIITDTEIVTELLDHVDRGYGRTVAVGEREVVEGQVVESMSTSELHGETEVIVAPANPETGEVERETLRQELTEPSGTGHAEEYG